MSNNNDISVQMASVSYTLQHPDGSAATAQEVYDAFMSGLVILQNNGNNYLATSLDWMDANAGNDDPANVVWVNIASSLTNIEIGTQPGE